MSPFVLLVAVVTVSISVGSFARRAASKHLLPAESLMLNVTAVLLLAATVLTALGLATWGRASYVRPRWWRDHMTPRQYAWLAGAALTSVVAWFGLVELSRSSDITQYFPFIQPVVLLLVLLIGLFVFGERVSGLQVVGYVAVFVGMVLVQVGRPAGSE
jgi:drug/metabolite transporter (DMT)-like permease